MRFKTARCRSNISDFGFAKSYSLSAVDDPDSIIYDALLWIINSVVRLTQNTMAHFD